MQFICASYCRKRSEWVDCEIVIGGRGLNTSAVVIYMWSNGGYEWSNDIKTRGIVCPHLSLDGPSLVIQSGREDDPPRIDKSKIQNETYANEPPF